MYNSNLNIDSNYPISDLFNTGRDLFPIHKDPLYYFLVPKALKLATLIKEYAQLVARKEAIEKSMRSQDTINQTEFLKNGLNTTNCEPQLVKNAVKQLKDWWIWQPVSSRQSLQNYLEDKKNYSEHLNAQYLFELVCQIDPVYLLSEELQQCATQTLALSTSHEQELKCLFVLNEGYISQLGLRLIDNICSLRTVNQSLREIKEDIVEKRYENNISKWLELLKKLDFVEYEDLSNRIKYKAYSELALHKTLKALSHCLQKEFVNAYEELLYALNLWCEYKQAILTYAQSRQNSYYAQFIKLIENTAIEKVLATNWLIEHISKYTALCEERTFYLKQFHDNVEKIFAAESEIELAGNKCMMLYAIALFENIYKQRSNVLDKNVDQRLLHTLDDGLSEIINQYPTNLHQSFWSGSGWKNTWDPYAKRDCLRLENDNVLEKSIRCMTL